MRILGIETSCDETAVSVVENGQTILSNVLFSQIELHRPLGGVLPERASRSHFEKMLPMVEQALKEASLSLKEIDGIAVTRGPGLIGSLLVGLETAKALSLALDIPFKGIHHVEAHLYAAMMPALEKLQFPLLGVVLSGGHTSLIRIDSIGAYSPIAATIDDAIGEAFDKVATLLDLPYPGGPEIERLAKDGDPKAYPFHPCVVKNKPLDFSFSGLKTKVLYTIKGQNCTKNSSSSLSSQEKADIAASFQRAAFEDIERKISLILKEQDYQGLVFGGGVCQSQALRKRIKEKFSSIPLYFPAKDLSTDNAAMIAGLAYHKFLESPLSDPLDLEACPRIALV